MSLFGGLVGVNPYGKSGGGHDSSGRRNLKKQLRPIRAMLHCYFCGGRVISIGPSKKAAAYRCEAEGVRWEASENLVIYSRYEGPPRQRRDPDTGKYLSAGASV